MSFEEASQLLQSDDDSIDEEENEPVEEALFEFHLESTACNYGPFIFSDFVFELESLIERDYSSSPEALKDEFFFLFFNTLSKLPKGVQYGKFGLGNIRNDLMSAIFKLKSMPPVSQSLLFSSSVWTSDKDHQGIVIKKKSIKFDKWGSLRLFILYIQIYYYNLIFILIIQDLLVFKNFIFKSFKLVFIRTVLNIRL
jgi:hypothetical protein